MTISTDHHADQAPAVRRRRLILRRPQLGEWLILFAVLCSASDLLLGVRDVLS
jgi:hypothetical protein